MRVTTLLLMLAALALAIAGCGSRIEIPDPPDDIAQTQALAGAELGVYWQVDLTLNPGERVNRLCLLGQSLYCLTTHNRLMSLEAARGRSQWTFAPSRPDVHLYTPLHADGVVVPAGLPGNAPDKPGLVVTDQVQPFDAVIVNTLSDVLVLDRATGKVNMKVPLGFPAGTGGALAQIATGKYVYYLASATGQCYALDLSRALNLWQTDMGAAVRAAPAFYAGMLFVADEAGVLHAGSADPSGPKSLWNSNQIDSQPMHGAVTADLVIDERGCFVPCQDNRLYAFDRTTGKALWPPIVCQGPLRQSPQVGENTIFQYATRDRLYAVDIPTGTQRWALPAGRVVVALVRDRGSHVYLIDDANTLRVIEEISGQELASSPMTGFDVYLPNATVPAVYAASRTGRVACIRPLAAGRLTPEMVQPTSP